MYHHPFPTPATPGQRDPFQFPHPPQLTHASHTAHTALPSSSSLQHHPVQRHPSHSNSAGSSRRGSRVHTPHEQYSDSESDGEEDKAERDKLEMRREKNRVKQRNLRLRRANHIADLERDVSTLKSEASALQTSLSLSQQCEGNLQGWIHDLESALFRNGLAAEVEGIRRIWSDREMKRPRGSVSSVAAVGPPYQSAAPMPDSLSTLARAASQLPVSHPTMYNGALPTPGASSSSQINGVGGGRLTLPRPSSFSRSYENPYPTPDVNWSSQVHEYIPAPPGIFEGNEQKRKRSSDWEPYGFSRPPTQHEMNTRRSESNINVLPPIQPLNSETSRPLSAPHSQPHPTSQYHQQQQQHQQHQQQQQQQQQQHQQQHQQRDGRGEDKGIRISDLVSPSQTGETFWGGEMKRGENVSPKGIANFSNVSGVKLPPFNFQPAVTGDVGARPEAGSPKYKPQFDGKGGVYSAPLSDLRV